MKINLDDIRRQWIGHGESMQFGDMMILLKAVGTLDQENSKDDLAVCTRYGLRPKAIAEIRKVRRQLIKIGKDIASHARIRHSIEPELLRNAVRKYARQRSADREFSCLLFFF